MVVYEKLIEKIFKELREINYKFLHDMSAPIRHVDGFAEILLKNIDNLSEKEIKKLNQIKKAALKAEFILDLMREYSRLFSVEIDTFKAYELNQIVQAISVTKNISISYNYCKKHKVVVAKPILEFSLIKLLNNIANLSEGKIEVAVSAESLDNTVIANLSISNLNLIRHKDILSSKLRKLLYEPIESIERYEKLNLSKLATSVEVLHFVQAVNNGDLNTSWNDKNNSFNLALSFPNIMN